MTTAPLDTVCPYGNEIEQWVSAIDEGFDAYRGGARKRCVTRSVEFDRLSPLLMSHHARLLCTELKARGFAVSRIGLFTYAVTRIVQ